MAALQGTILASKIVPTDSLDTYATHEDKYGRGGHRSVDTLEERDNITTPRRKEGMTVYVKENKTKYILDGGIDNANWKVDSSVGGSSGGAVDLGDYYKKTETYSKVEVDTIIDNIPEPDLTNYYNKTEVDIIALDKVDKVVGKQLSTEDYTTAEKTKLTGLSNYVKPSSEPISYIDGLQTALVDKVDKVSKQALDSNNALRVTGTTISLYKGDGTFDSITTQDTIYTHPNSGVIAGTYPKVTVNTLGHITNGSSLLESDIPSLDASKITSGTIDSARLPSFVDDVLEFANLAGFPTTGETGKIYIALDTNKTYRWSGSTYVFITSGAVDSVAGKTGVVTLVKSDVGLGNVDNTSDLNKPISTATQTALNTKVDKVAGKQLSTEDYTTADKTKLSGLSNYTKPASEPISYITGLQTALDSKVSKNGVEALHSTDALRISGTTLSLYKGDGTFESVVTQDTVYTLPKASATVLGGIKVGTNLSIDANGVLSANNTNVSFTEISNKPTNLSGYGITDAYTKTEVDNLIPDISTKQDTLVSATNIKTINGESILGSGDINIEGGGSLPIYTEDDKNKVLTIDEVSGAPSWQPSKGGSGSSTFTGTASIDIGGVKVGDSWDSAPIEDVVNSIINPELFPTFINPTFSFVSTVNGFREVGSIADITFNVNFNRGSITPQYSAENNYRSGLPTAYNYSGPAGSEVKASNSLTDTKTITGYNIAIGNNTFSCSVDYSIGTQPKSSKGNDYNTPLPAGTLSAKSVTITGVYPVYRGIGTLSKIPLQAHGTAIVVDAPADMDVNGNRFTIQYPNVWSGKTPIVQQENELSKAWDNQNMAEYEITDIDISGIPYKQVKYIGSGIGARKLKLVF